MARLSSGQSIGQRERQEDALRIVHQSDAADDGEVLLIVADGMGGHAGGDVASNLAIDTFVDHFQNISQNMRPRGRLEEAARAANDAIKAQVAKQPDLRGMGCTLLAMLVVEGRLIWCSVGDSILFHLRNGEIRRLNADHSYFGELLEMVARGEMTLEQARAHPSKNALRSAITGEPLKLIDVNTVMSEPGDIVILASDGLETLSDDEIAAIVFARPKAATREIVTALLDGVAQKNRPKQDNTSLILFRESGDLRPSTLGDNKWNLAALNDRQRRSVLPYGLAAAGLFVVGLLLVFALSGEPDPPPPVVEQDPIITIAPAGTDDGGSVIGDSAPIEAAPIETGPIEAAPEAGDIVDSQTPDASASGEDAPEAGGSEAGPGADTPDADTPDTATPDTATPETVAPETDLPDAGAAPAGPGVEDAEAVDGQAVDGQGAGGVSPEDINRAVRDAVGASPPAAGTDGAPDAAAEPEAGGD